MLALGFGAGVKYVLVEFTAAEGELWRTDLGATSDRYTVAIDDARVVVRAQSRDELRAFARSTGKPL